VEYGHVCLRGFFWGYWNCNHSKIIVRKQSKDICRLCYQFHLGDRTTASSSTPNNLDNDESSLQSVGDSNKGNDEDGTLMEAHERETQKIANEIKQHIKDATSMRALCQKVIKDAEAATGDNVADKDMLITLVVDYCQNMEFLFFGKDQPGETYYYTPKSTCLGLWTAIP
jgi:NAD-specific glutamate dehydrogenase